MNQELENYIKQERSTGTNDEAIKQKLIANGWKDEMFNEYFSEHSQETKKHKKLIFIIIGAIMTLGIGAYFVFAQTGLLFNKTTNIIKEAREECSQFSEESTEFLNCYINLAKKYKDPEFCNIELVNPHNEEGFFQKICLYYMYEDEISKGECEKTPELIQDSCYGTLSRVDITACEKVVGLDNRDSCYDQANVLNPNAETCPKIKNLDLRNACYFDTAKKTNDATLCSKIPDEDLEAICIQAVGKTTGEVNCEVLDDSETKDYCYFENALSKNDIAQCFFIESGIIMYDCYYRGGFLINSEPEICKKINAVSAGEKQALAQCFNVFVELGKVTDPKLCEDNGVSCNIKLAAATKDIKFCKTAEDWEKNLCYLELAVATLDTSFCDANPRAFAADIEWCKKRVKAISENNPSYCEEFNSNKDCYEDYAIYFKKPEYCKKLLEPYQKMCELRSQ